MKESLQRLVFTPVFDVYQLMEALWNPNMSSYKLIIVDSLATLFMPILGGSSNDGDNCFDSNLLIFSSFNMLKAISLLNKVASDLKRIAVVHRCAVLVINHEAKQKSEEPIPALGRYWLSVPNLRLHCKRLNASEIELSIVRNVYCPDVEPKCKFTFSEVEVESTSVQSSSACSRSAT